jgi:hypothetical protein
LVSSRKVNLKKDTRRSVKIHYAGLRDWTACGRMLVVATRWTAVPRLVDCPKCLSKMKLERGNVG